MKKKIKTLLKILFNPVFSRYNFIVNKICEIDALNKQLLEELCRIEDKINSIVNKLSLNNGIIELKGARFFIPNAPRDYIQNVQLSEGNFFNFDTLQSIDKYLNRESVIVDIGANVGNHTVYWGKITNVKKIYAFEPIKATFDILSKNVEINNITNKVKKYNIGLGERRGGGDK